jgi:hypothetical protein
VVSRAPVVIIIIAVTIRVSRGAVVVPRGVVVMVMTAATDVMTMVHCTLAAAWNPKGSRINVTAAEAARVVLRARGLHDSIATQSVPITPAPLGEAARMHIALVRVVVQRIRDNCGVRVRVPVAPHRGERSAVAHGVLARKNDPTKAPLGVAPNSVTDVHSSSRSSDPAGFIKNVATTAWPKADSIAQIGAAATGGRLSRVCNMITTAPTKMLHTAPIAR